MEFGIGIVWLTVILLGSLLLLLLMGLPVVFALGGIGTFFSIWFFGFNSTLGVYMNTWASFTSQVLLAIPLFLLMASVLQYSGIADGFYGMFQKWMGGFNGGLAIGTVVICVIFAALTGTSGAATVSMGLIAIPSMLSRGYNKYMVVGTVAAAGVLGIVIPPSIIMIVYSVIAHVSIGKMFLAGILPGIMCGIFFCIYIGIRCWYRPKDGPVLPLDQRATWGEKLISLKELILPILLVVGVLGSIWGGVATPTEAAAIGAIGSIICTIVYGYFNLTLLKKAAQQTLGLTAMIFWILAGATVFSNLYTQLGARSMIEAYITAGNVSPWVVVIFMQLSLFVLGMIMDDYAIIMLTSPIYVPIVVLLGFDPVWFGIIFILNMSQAYLTPPYGFNLFYLRSIMPVVEKQTGITISMLDIYKAVVPFVLIGLLNMVIVMIFPAIAIWLPNLIYGK